MIEPQRWTLDDVPAGPYFHGSRTDYEEGAPLHVDEVNPEDPDPERQDTREMCFATTCFRSALQWAHQRRANSNGGRTLRVYEVHLLDPEIDTNAEGWWRQEGGAHSVMAPSGVIANLHLALDEGEYVERAMLDELHRCPSDCNVGCGSGELRLDHLTNPRTRPL